MSGEHVRHRVSLVLELWDDFSDRPLSDPSIEIVADGTIRPIRKADGFYVFVNCRLPLHVEIRSEQYETEEFDAGIQGEEAVIIKKDCVREKITRSRTGQPALREFCIRASGSEPQ